LKLQEAELKASIEVQRKIEEQKIIAAAPVLCERARYTDNSNTHTTKQTKQHVTPIKKD
jgi:hypothetical protein